MQSIFPGKNKRHLTRSRSLALATGFVTTNQYTMQVADDLTTSGRGIRGTHLESSIQDIVDEVTPIKKGPPMGLRADSFKCDVTRLFRGL